MDSPDLLSAPIPDEEITHLLLTLTDAFHLAATGETRRGYLKVLGGVVRVAGFDRQAQRWAPALHAHWNRALQEYLERYPGSDRYDDRPVPTAPADRIPIAELT